ncbi:hypothetical protein FKW77_006403 [Venturia effusa]|uniref:Transcription factor domain-containing protein n=1 Tax=Venturia effusa TaxID=50376 RepID=A0A517L1H7_9PEZI|nr:hypothetical protein FKW77_006403 [Venturia effusa]
MYETFWGSQKQFAYSSGVAVMSRGKVGKGQRGQRRKYSKTGTRCSRVEVMRCEETFEHYTTTTENQYSATFSHSAPPPPTKPKSYDSLRRKGTTGPVPPDALISAGNESSKEEEEEEEMEEIVRPSTPGSALELLDSKTRWLFVHFLTQVSPYCIILDDDNGFRSHVLPFAVHCPLVRRAVCVTAAFHLSQKVPSLRADAEAGRGIVIKMLQDLASQSVTLPQHHERQFAQGPYPTGFDASGSDVSRASSPGASSYGLRDSPVEQQRVFADSSWCCLILLILGDLITGSADIMALRKTLVSFREGRKREGMGSGPLVDFLEYQSGLIEFVARPMSSTPGQDACESFHLDHRKYESSPAIQLTITQYNQCFKLARRVYHYRLQESTLTPEQAVELDHLSRDLKMILMSIDANVPGSHAPLWPCFVAGCEASTQVERDFFYTRLEIIWRKTWSRNPFVAMKGLLYIWSLGPNVNWAEKIKDLDHKRDALIRG